MAAPTPDGRQIAFTTGQGGDLSGGYTNDPNWVGIEKETIGQNNPVRVAGDGTYGPRFSPDGRSLAYWQESANASRVVVAKTDGAGARTVWSSTRRHANLAELDWSPDASHLVIQRPGQGPGL